MSPDEILDMDRRVGVQSQLGEMTARLSSDPQFAGLYLDQRADGEVVVLTTGSEAAVRAEIRGVTPPASSIRVASARYSLAVLEALQSQITDSAANLRSKGIVLASVGVDVAQNRVRVDVVNPTSDEIGLIAQQFGDAAYVQAGELATPATCISRSNCGSPLKGGLGISGGGWTCTSGYLGRIQGSSGLFLITAGHCLADSGLSATWYHYTTAIGTGYVYDYANGANADAGAIRASEPLARNEAYATSNTDIRSMTSTLSNSAQPTGSTICRSGLNSGYYCAVVSSINRDVWDGPYLIHHMWETDYTSQGGDSGGTMMVNWSWAGILDAYNSSHSYYTTSDWVQSTILGSPCTSAGC